MVTLGYIILRIFLEEGADPNLKKSQEKCQDHISCNAQF